MQIILTKLSGSSPCVCVWLLLTARLVCAAAVGLVDQLLSRLTAGGTWHGGTLDRVTLGTHGTAVAFTDAATAGPRLTGLMGEKQTVRNTVHVHRECVCVPGISSYLFGTPIRPNTIWNFKQKQYLEKRTGKRWFISITNLIVHLNIHRHKIILCVSYVLL